MDRKNKIWLIVLALLLVVAIVVAFVINGDLSTSKKSLEAISTQLATEQESRAALDQFDIVGFTLQYEMSFTNILESLDLAGIPLRREDRTEEHPFIICGGPCAFNPEPLAPFVDLIAIGRTGWTVDALKRYRCALLL